MTRYLITSAIALAALLTVYYLLLQREKMHRFNRFYLLGAIIFSLVFPFITIPVYVEAEPLPEITMPVIDTPVAAPAPVEAIIYWPYVLIGLYALVTLFLAIRFVRNIVHFKQVKKKHPNLPYKNATLVLMDEEVPPHTFFSSIFVSRNDYDKRYAEPELFTHELAHVNQRHTLDILAIEALKTILWFNPLLYVCKHAIQLNHEFLADEATINHHQNVTNYQHLLLGKAQPSLNVALASSINFAITKKRFIMMTKTTSKNRAMLLKVSALPVLAGLLVTLSTETIAQQPAGNELVATARALDNDRDEYYSGVRVKIEDKVKGITIDKVYEDLTAAEKDRYMFDVPTRRSKKQPTAKELESYKDKKTYALWIDNKNVDNSVLNNYKPEDFALYVGSFVHKNARTKQHPQNYQFTLYTHAYYDKNFATFHYPGDTYQMNIAKEFKNGVEVKQSKAVITNPATGSRIITSVNHNEQEQEDYSYTLKGNAIANGLKAGADQDKVFGAQETQPQPEYPGGITAFYKLILDNYKIDGKLKGNLKMIVKFVIEADGTVTDVKVEKAFTQELGDELVRVVKLSEKWKPGYVNGKAVRTFYILPVQINEN